MSQNDKSFSGGINVFNILFSFLNLQTKNNFFMFIENSIFLYYFLEFLEAYYCPKDNTF